MRELTDLHTSRRAAEALAREAYPSLDDVNREHEEMVKQIRKVRNRESDMAKRMRERNEG